MDRDEIWEHVHTQRRVLAELLAELTPGEWETPSLCAGWTVRDVAAHVILSPQATLSWTLAALARARGSFDRCMYDEARRSARRPVAEIVEDYRRYDGSRRRPPGTGRLDPLVDVLVHTQDIAVPLGREVPMPIEDCRAAVGRVWAMSFPHRARRRFAGRRLVATDVDWSAGSGEPLEAPVGELLLLMTGRPAATPV